MKHLLIELSPTRKKMFQLVWFPTLFSIRTLHYKELPFKSVCSNKYRNPEFSNRPAKSVCCYVLHNCHFNL